ncbi:MAG: hypothetical protein ACHQRJ_11815 [Alphaproteobacteria bacterium]
MTKKDNIPLGCAEAKRRRPQGFGATKRAAPNAKPDGSDDPEGRQKNLRVEIVLAKRGRDPARSAAHVETDALGKRQLL